MKTKHLLTTLLTLVVCVAAGASRHNPDVELPRLQTQLRIAGTSSDSVKILYDMYDLQPRAQRLGTGKEIFRVAGNAGDVSAQLDAVRPYQIAANGTEKAWGKTAIVERCLRQIPP